MCRGNLFPLPWENRDFISVLWSPLFTDTVTFMHTGSEARWTFVLFAFAKGRCLPPVKSISHCNSVFTVLPCQRENMNENKHGAWRKCASETGVLQNTWGGFKCKAHVWSALTGVCRWCPFMGKADCRNSFTMLDEMPGWLKGQPSKNKVSDCTLIRDWRRFCALRHVL